MARLRPRASLASCETLVFVTFEGIEGCGKSTQHASLGAALRARGWVVTATREPGGSPAGERIRPLLTDPTGPPLVPMAELFLYLADRAQHVRTTIRPALDRKHVVLCDRFSDSTLAYQGHGRAGDLEAIRRLDEIARDGCRPDLTFLLDCPVEIGLERARTRPGTRPTEDRFEGEPEAFHQRVRAGFLALAGEAPDRFVVLDARKPVPELERAILGETLRRLEPRSRP